MSLALKGQWEHQPGAFSQPKVSSGLSSNFPAWLPSYLAPLTLRIKSKFSGLASRPSAVWAQDRPPGLFPSNSPAFVHAEPCAWKAHCLHR